MQRTLNLAAEVSFLGPVGAALMWITPMAVLVPQAFGLYLLYLYCLEVGAVPKKKAQIFVGILAGLSLLGSLTPGFMAGWFSRGYRPY